MAITYKPDAVVNQMLHIVAKKKRLKPDKLIDTLIEQAYQTYG